MFVLFCPICLSQRDLDSIGSYFIFDLTGCFLKPEGTFASTHWKQAELLVLMLEKMTKINELLKNVLTFLL